jgi:4-hydroxythreonine-4-phosphate dehydrogenase
MPTDIFDKPLLGITMGDPAGVGPEICVKVCQNPTLLDLCTPLILGSPRVLHTVAGHLGLVPPPEIEPDELAKISGPAVLDCEAEYFDVTPGQISAACGKAAYTYVMEGIQLAMAHRIDAVVTAPLNKAALNLAGIHENGHTEIFARETNSPAFALMLYSPRLICAFATCHQSLASVPQSLSIERIVETASLLHEAVLKINGQAPRIGLPGLNPHAGEGGLFGQEEIEILLPAVKIIRESGISISDPLPPDTVFTPDAIGKYDAYLCLYHDQGHIPFKMISFHDGVNTTLGLPIIRTSVDHGTAFDIAWQGKAATTSLEAAIKLAAALARKKVS